MTKVETIRLFVTSNDENRHIPTIVLRWLSEYADHIEAGTVAQTEKPRIIATMMCDDSCIYGVDFRSEGGAEIVFRNPPINTCYLSSSNSESPATKKHKRRKT